MFDFQGKVLVALVYQKVFKYFAIYLPVLMTTCSSGFIAEPLKFIIVFTNL